MVDENLLDSKFLVELHSKHVNGDDIGYFRAVVTAFNNGRLSACGHETGDAKRYCKLADDLLQTLISDVSLDVESRLLCATAFFCVVLTKSMQIARKQYFDKIITLLMVSHPRTHESDNHCKLTAHCIAYGLCQSNFFSCDIVDTTEKIRLIKCCESLLTKHCMSYSDLTHISFRIFYLLIRKVAECKIKYPLDFYYILYITTTNWENPVTGVRDINCMIFGNVLDLIPDDLYKNILNDLKSMPWYKAKYLMLAEILNHKGTDLINNDFFNGNEFREGLMYSLCVPDCVSAGANVYRAFMKFLKTLQEWNVTFFQHIEVFIINENMYCIRNLCDHWLPDTIKAFPHALNDIFKMLDKTQSRVNILYVCNVILKWRKKLGIIEILDTRQITVLEQSLVHLDENLRRIAFQTLCASNKLSIPTAEEFEHIKNFLTYNINSDCTPLRQSIISNFSVFLIRLRSSYYQAITNQATSMQENNLHCLKTFFQWLDIFLLKNLQTAGNYQRKISSLYMLEAILHCFNGRGNSTHKKLIKTDDGIRGLHLLSYIVSEKCWNFMTEMGVDAIIKCLMSPNADIRDKSSHILITFLSSDIYLQKILSNLYLKGREMCCSRYFYESDCGQCLILLVSDVSMKSNCELLYNKREELLYNIYEDCVKFQQNQEVDLLFSISQNNIYHTLLSTMGELLTRLQTKETNELNFLFLNSLHSFLESKVIKYNLSLFTSEKKDELHDGLSNFAEMGKCIDDIVKMSKYTHITPEIKENTKGLITNEHQIVLNCIWLNIKAGCNMCSAIIAYIIGRGVAANDTISKCLGTMIMVLRNCLHKGIIESAATALGCSIKQLTSSFSTSSLAESSLEKFLNDELNTFEDERNVRRRSAGLALCIRAFVANDSNKSKILFHKTMRHFVNHLEERQLKGEDIIEAFDMSKSSTLLHLCSATIRDSGLSMHVMQYATSLMSLCFHFLKSKHWQIRNGALQMFGSLVPKLTGQKSNQEDSASMSPEELFSHFPRLWSDIKNILSKALSVESHSLYHNDLVPVLTFLSSLSSKYSLSTTLSSLTGVSYDGLFDSLAMLLTSPNHTVRRLCAVTMTRFFDFDTLHRLILECGNAFLQNNELHGILLLFQQIIKQRENRKKLLSFVEDDIAQKSFLKLKDYGILRMDSHYSYVIICLQREIGNSLLFKFSEQNTIISPYHALNNVRTIFSPEPQAYCIIEYTFSFIIKETQPDQLITFLPSILRCIIEYTFPLSLENIFEELKKRILKDDMTLNQINTCIDILFKEIKKQNSSSPGGDFQIFHQTLEELFKGHCMKNNLLLLIMKCPLNGQLCKMDMRRCRTTKVNQLYNIIFTILDSKSELCSRFENTSYDKLLIDVMEKNMSKQNLYNDGLLLPLVARILMHKNPLIHDTAYLQISLSKMVRSLSQPNDYESEKRYIAALTINRVECLQQFSRWTTESKCNILLTAIWLLQDEDSKVRNEATRFYQNLTDREPINPSICLHNIVSEQFMMTIFNRNKSDIKHFLKEILQDISRATDRENRNYGITNPFSNESSNVYWEPRLLKIDIEEILMHFEDLS